MLQEYARTDRTSEIERKKVIESICTGFSNIGQQKVIFSLSGNSGIGKSFICKTLLQSDLIVPSCYKVLIDLNQIANNNIPGIIQAVVATLGFGFFSITQVNLDRYFKSIDASKPECLAVCVDAFIDELNIFAEQCGGILLIVDTFEALSANAEKSGFRKILQATNDNVNFLIAGISKCELCHCTAEFHLKGFDEDEIIKFLITRNSKMKSVFKKHGTLLASQIRQYTDNGNPILCGLISDWLLHCQDLGAQVDYLLSSKETSRKHLINWICTIDKDLFTALRLSAFFPDRMNPDLLSAMSDMNTSRARECLQEIAEFSFVKVYSDTYDPDPQIVLHDVVGELIRDYFPFSPEQLCSLAGLAVAVYDDLIIEDRANSEAFKLEQSLRVEKVMCLVRNGAFDDAFVMFDNEILDGIDVFDFSFVDQLINEVESYLNNVLKKRLNDNQCSEKQKWEYVVQIAKAEELLSKYLAREAVVIYEKLKGNELYKTAQFKTIADDMFARALVNPCSVDCGKTAIDAIRIMKSTSQTISKSRLNRRIVKSFYWLGNAYIRSGQNGEAQTSYEFALSKCQTDIQKVMVLLDMSKMVRLQQDVRGALEPLQKCDVLMESMAKNKGKYHYYKGNVYRDLNDIATAIIYYNKAFEELSNGDDNFTLCELNLDYAWLQYIRDDVAEINIDEVQKFLGKGWELAQAYHFGTEYSEYHHILYEILNYLGNQEEAYDHLDEALKFAYKYSNIYMILDCLNHRAQQFYRENKIELVPAVIQEMERIEKSGCKIRVFRGRAKLVQADIYYQEKQYGSAIQEYFDGFLIVALYGNSRTNVELFDDLYCSKEDLALSRKEKMIDCLNRIAESDKIRRKLRNTWNKRVHSDEYRYFIDGLKK